MRAENREQDLRDFKKEPSEKTLMSGIMNIQTLSERLCFLLPERREGN